MPILDIVGTGQMNIEWLFQFGGEWGTVAVMSPRASARPFAARSFEDDETNERPQR